MRKEDVFLSTHGVYRDTTRPESLSHTISPLFSSSKGGLSYLLESTEMDSVALGQADGYAGLHDFVN